MVKLAHISDLHFGRTNPRAVAALADALADEAPDLVVATGDFTQSGRAREFEEAEIFLRSLNRPVLAIPGNHDAPVYNLALRFLKPWARFERHIGPSGVQSVVVGDVMLIGLNSARRAAPRLNWAYGRLRRRTIEDVERAANEARDRQLTAIVACHHPFFTGPSKAAAEIVGNGELALARFAASGVRIVMTGHAHVGAIRPLEMTQNRILALQAGTATSTRDRGEPAGFTMIRLGEQELTATFWNFEKDVFTPFRRRQFSLTDGAWRGAVD